MSTRLDPEIEAALESAIADAAGEEISRMTRWVIVGEGIDEEGGMVLTELSSTGLPQWEAYGLLAYHAAGNVPQPRWMERE